MQLQYLDSLQQEQQSQIANLNDRLFLSGANTELAELRESAAVQQATEYAAKLAKEEKRKRTFRTLCIISTGLLMGYYGYNQFK